MSELSHFEEDPPMKWHVKTLYVKAMYVAVILASLVAAASAGYKWW